MFVTTNYIPVVNETDHGTWRRLALVVVPYTFRKPGEPLTGPADRRGDPQLKARLRAGAQGQHDAIVTWAVEGARRWYESDFPPLPPSVEADTRAWRKEADRILGFWDDLLVADRAACVITTELHMAFNSWMEANGHNGWSRELFGSRFRAHAETARYHVEEHRPRTLDDLRVSRPVGSIARFPERPRVYVGVRFRVPGEIDEINENTKENGKWSTWSNPLETSLYRDDPRKVGKGLDQVDQRRCDGGELPSSDESRERGEL